MKKIFILLIIIFLLPSVKSTADNKVIIEHVKQELTNAGSPKDSIRLLYDLFDLSQRKEQIKIGNKILELGSRTNNEDVQLDILRQMANITRNISVLKNIEAHARKMRATKAQKETLLFIHMKQVSVQARYLPEKHRQMKIAEIITTNNFDKLDKYGKIEQLFTICEYLSNYADGKLLIEYMSDLEELMNEADLDSYALKNLFYGESANIYTYSNEGSKALEADRKLLNIISKLEKEYKSKGRRYRNYNISRYVILRRMMSNFKWLDTPEINNIYSQILALTEADPDVKADFWKKRRTSAYHAMENGRYTEAIPYIEQSLESEKSMPIRKQLCEMLIEASKKAGDTISLKRANNMYRGIKQEYDSLHTKTKYNELQIRYQVNILKTDNARMVLEKKDAEITSARRIMTFVIVGWVVLGIFLVLMLILWTRYKRNIINLGKFVDTLAQERDRLKSKRALKHLKNYTPPATLLNSKQRNSADGMINFILNDLLYISAIGQDYADQYMEWVNVGEFLKERFTTLNAHLRKNVEVEVKYPDPNFDIYIDRICLTKITDHILHLAVRLTPAGGKAGFECTLDESGKNAKLKFWHEGNPLPDNKEELIFDSFLTFDTMTEEKHAALRMCRMIHFLLESTMYVDKSNKDIVTLTITIPVDGDKKQGLATT